MRNISFFMTTAQVYAKEKDVTRRLGWENLKVGERLQAIVKGQGLGKGGKIEKICVIEVVNVRRERLDMMLNRGRWGDEECRREGFPEMTPSQFVEFFCKGHKGCKPYTVVTRIEFKYIPKSPR